MCGRYTRKLTWKEIANLSLLLFACPAFAQTIVDGDTIKLDGTTYRLATSPAR